jgi:hypothetical protein
MPDVRWIDLGIRILAAVLRAVERSRSRGQPEHHRALTKEANGAVSPAVAGPIRGYESSCFMKTIEARMMARRARRSDIAPASRASMS